MNTCIVSWCEKSVFGISYCSAHYQHVRKYGSVNHMKVRVIRASTYKARRVRISIVCVAKNCRTVSISKGLCEKHYTRLRNHGDTSVTMRVTGEMRHRHPLYKSYHAMLARCYKPQHQSYAYYGGRGITVCERWQGPQGFSNFLADMGERPQGLTLDRTDNSRGYSPENCRWTSRSEQQKNRRKQSNNVSGTAGVTLYKNGKWTAQIYIDGKKKHLGYYKVKQDAIAARQAAEN